MATETTFSSAKAWSPDLHRFAAADVVPNALIMQTSTIAGAIEGDEPFVRVAYVDDADATFVAEGDPIPESDPDLAEAIVATGKIALLVRISREQYVQMGTADQLAKSVERAVVRKADAAYLAQVAPIDPASTPPAGILNVSGIVDGGTVAGDLDELVDLLATLETNGATPSHVLLSPTAWASLSKFKTATGSAQNLLGAGVDAPQRRLLGLPVLVNSAVPTGTGLILDRAAVVSAVGPLNVAVSREQYFSSDSIGVRATWRIGQTLVRPDRLGKFSVTDPA